MAKPVNPVNAVGPADRYSKIALDTKGKLRDAWNSFAKKFQVIENYQSKI